MPEIIDLSKALNAWGIGRTAYYQRIKLDHPAHDPETPLGFKSADHATAKRVFTTDEVQRYAQVLIARGRTRAAAGGDAAKERAALMVAARKGRRNANAGE